MAHNLNFNERTGRYSFFSVQEKAWHGLGQIVKDYPTSSEAIQHAGLDYEVIKSLLFPRIELFAQLFLTTLFYLVSNNIALNGVEDHGCHTSHF